MTEDKEKFDRQLKVVRAFIGIPPHQVIHELLELTTTAMIASGVDTKSVELWLVAAKKIFSNQEEE
jgi:hypothetical protein